MEEQKEVTLLIPFNNNQNTVLVSEVLNVDKELKGSGIKREINVQENCLLVIFKGGDYKKLRVTINAFMKNILLIVKTIKLLN